jgi:hypothetical protein
LSHAQLGGYWNLADSWWLGRIVNQFYMSCMEELQNPVLVSIVLRARSGFIISDQVRGQGVPLFENGAYMPVREYFK